MARPGRKPGTAAATVHRTQIIKRLLDGEYVSQIAKELGCSPAAISNGLHDDQEYRSAREAGMELRLKRFENELEQSSDQLAVSRTRELLSHQRWRAEREFPHRWGAKAQVEVTNKVTVDDALDGMASALLDKMRVVESDDGVGRGNGGT